MRRIVRRQITTIEIVSVEFTWSEEKDPGESAPEETIMETPPRLAKTKTARRKRKTDTRTHKRSKKVGTLLLDSTSK